jgi:flagellar basal body-associated protein FliL
MNNDLLFLILAIVVLIVFGVIVGYWFYTSSKDYVVNNDVQHPIKTLNRKSQPKLDKIEPESINNNLNQTL